MKPAAMTDAMLSAQRLYATLRECGATLSKGENGKIRIKSTHDVLGIFRADIRAHRAELLVLIEEADAAPGADTSTTTSATPKAMPATATPATPTKTKPAATTVTPATAPKATPAAVTPATSPKPLPPSDPAGLTQDDLEHRQRIAARLGLTRLDLSTARRKAKQYFPEASARALELHALILATCSRKGLTPPTAAKLVQDAVGETTLN